MEIVASSMVLLGRLASFQLVCLGLSAKQDSELLNSKVNRRLLAAKINMHNMFDLNGVVQICSFYQSSLMAERSCVRDRVTR